MNASGARLGRHSARIWIIFLLGLLGLPGLLSVQRALSKAPDPSLSQLPARPASFADWSAMPPRLDAWTADHVGGRKQFIRLGTIVHFHLFHEFLTNQMAVGRHGRYFLASHSAKGAHFQAIHAVCGKGVANAGTVPYLNRMFGAFHAAGLQPALLVVPSAAVHPEDLSPELVAGAAAQNILYPLKEMREIKKSATLFPLT